MNASNFYERLVPKEFQQSQDFGHTTDQLSSDSGQNLALEDLPTTSKATSQQYEALKSYGRPGKKHYVDSKDLASLTISISCCIAAVVVVEINNIAWILGYNNQLKVIGFLLSIMNLCLGRITKYVLVLVEARYGPSTLQNYDGILTNQFLAKQQHMAWRLVISMFLALPLGLSVAYKGFPGGFSYKEVKATQIVDALASPDYGLFTVPGMTLVHAYGLSVYFNASLPFRHASQPSYPANIEPALPTMFPRAYGANTLILSNSATAMLDLPRTDRVQEFQDWLSIGESLTITAEVHGTVVEHNFTLHPQIDPLFNSTFYHNGSAITGEDLFTGWSVAMLWPYLRGSDQSHIWYGFVPNPFDSKHQNIFESLSKHSKRYDISRRNCRGTWSVTRGGIELMEGFCDSTLLPGLNQYVLQSNQSNQLMLGDKFLRTMAESVGYFAKQQDQSPWQNISMTTFAAGMVWSSLMSVNGVAMLSNNTPGEPLNGQLDDDSGLNLRDVGLLYVIPETIVSTRPTMQQGSVPLLVVFATQPVLMVTFILAVIFLYSAPMGKGFGIVSILAGIERDSLDVLQGASMSGQLKKEVRLNILPAQRDGNKIESTVRYRVGPVVDSAGNGRIQRGIVYS